MAGKGVGNMRSREFEAAVLALIESGEWKPGHKLPTTGEMMQQFEVSKNVVDLVMGWLISRGVIEGRQGGGRYVR